MTTTRTRTTNCSNHELSSCNYTKINSILLLILLTRVNIKILKKIKEGILLGDKEGIYSGDQMIKLFVHEC